MTKQQEIMLEKQMKETLESVRNKSIHAGASSMLSAVLQMCNEGKSIEDIRRFCRIFLSISGR